MLNALSRFVEKSADYAFPFFKLLQKEAAFEECALALRSKVVSSCRPFLQNLAKRSCF